MKNLLWNSRWKTSLAVALVAGLVTAPAVAQTIIDEWASVKAPPAPELKPVTIDAKTTAFLVLDFVRQTCNNERRPRCIASIPRVQKLLAEARAKGLPVIYSLIVGATAADIVKELAPTGGETMVTAMADKFTGTDRGPRRHPLHRKRCGVSWNPGRGSGGRHVGREHLCRTVHDLATGQRAHRVQSCHADKDRFGPVLTGSGLTWIPPSRLCAARGEGEETFRIPSQCGEGARLFIILPSSPLCGRGLRWGRH